jgi:branched-chain amino acid transport system ATP-binding protein
VIPLLETCDLTVRYGGVIANSGVNVSIIAGSLVGLIGPNGAGKSTFIDAVTGFARPSLGTVHFDGTDITLRPPHNRAQLGLRRTFQSLELFEDITVAENLSVATERPRWFTFARDALSPTRHACDPGTIDWALGSVGLRDKATRYPSDLSHGQRKLVGVARALVSRPRLLLLDEPASGLDTSESEALGRELRRVLEQGTSMLLVDHDMSFVMSVCDYIYVLDFGVVIASGSPAEIRADPAVIAAYLGSSA